MPVGGISVNDPYFLTEVGDVNGATGYHMTGDRFRVSALPVGSSTGVIVAAGQSTAANYDDALYTPASSFVQNFDIYDGAVYAAKDPLLGCSGVGGCWLGRLGQKLIDGGAFTRVIIAPVAIGGTDVARWASSGDLNHRFGVTQRRLAAAGLTPSCLIWHQGERDKTIGTSQADYATRLASVIATWRGLYASVPIFVNQVSVTNYTADSNIANAQIASVDHPNGVWAGANADSLLSTNRQSDGTHWTATGSDAMAGLMVTALHAYGAPF